MGGLADAADIDKQMRKATGVRSGYPAMSPDAKRDILSRFFPKVSLTSGRLTIDVDQAAIIASLGSDNINLGSNPTPLKIECPIALRRRGVEAKLVLTAEPDVPRDPDPALQDVIFRAHRHLRQLTDATGRSLSEVARINETDVSEVSRLLPFAFLWPKIVDSILAGTQSPTISAQRLSRISDLPHSWAEQEARLAG